MPGITTLEETFRIVTADGRVIRVKPVAQDYDEEGTSCCAAISLDKHELYIWGALEPHIRLINKNDKVVQQCYNEKLTDEELLEMTVKNKPDEMKGVLA